MIDSRRPRPRWPTSTTWSRACASRASTTSPAMIAIACGMLVVAGNIVNFLAPLYCERHLGRGQCAERCRWLRSASFDNPETGVRSFRFQGVRGIPAVLCLRLSLHQRARPFRPRELGTFWPIYFMLFYASPAVVRLGLSCHRPCHHALTLIGYFFIGGAAFLLWMAVVNGGGLILGGLWMRWSE